MTAQAPIKQKGKKARRAKQAQSIAVAADIWQARDGKDRPTDERRNKGAFVLRDTEDAGVTVAVDEQATMLDALHRKGIIDGDQLQAGVSLAMLLHRTRLGSPGRSCLDFSPVGYDDSEPTHQELRDVQERAEIYLGVGMFTWAEMQRVCQEGQKPRDVKRLRDGLDFCAQYWGIVDRRR